MKFTNVNNRAGRSKNTKCLNFGILYLWRTSKRPQDEDNQHDLCRDLLQPNIIFNEKLSLMFIKISKAKFIQKSLTYSSYILSSWFIEFPFSSMSPILYSLWSVSAFLSLSPSLALKCFISFMSLAIYLSCSAPSSFNSSISFAFVSSFSLTVLLFFEFFTSWWNLPFVSKYWVTAKITWHLNCSFKSICKFQENCDAHIALLNVLFFTCLNLGVHEFFKLIWGYCEYCKLYS